MSEYCGTDIIGYKQRRGASAIVLRNRVCDLYPEAQCDVVLKHVRITGVFGHVSVTVVSCHVSVTAVLSHFVSLSF